MKVLTEFKLMTFIGVVIIFLLNSFLLSFGFSSKSLGLAFIECGLILWFYSAMIEKYFVLKEKKR